MQYLIYPSSIPNGANIIFPAFKGKVIGGSILMNILVPLQGSPKLLGTFYAVGGYSYVRMIYMSLNQVTSNLTAQLAIFRENPNYISDGTFNIELNITEELNDSAFFWEIASNPGKQSFLVVESMGGVHG